MSQSAGTTQWELGNKLACQLTALSLAIAGLWLVAQVSGCFSRKSDPLPQDPRRFPGQFTAQFFHRNSPNAVIQNDSECQNPALSRCCKLWKFEILMDQNIFSSAEQN